MSGFRFVPPLPPPERHVPRLMCATCRRELQVTENYEGGEYLGYEVEHGAVIPGTPEHSIEPMVIGDQDQLVEVCDFCSEGPSVPWVYPARDFSDVDVVGPDGIRKGFRSIGDWGACEDCHVDIEREDLERMFARQIEGMLRRREVSRQITRSPKFKDHKVMTLHLWREFMANRLGPAYRG